MPISSDQAADALGEVQQAERRISVLRGYEFAAPYFWLWGVVWVLGYGLTWSRPSSESPLWTVLDLAGVAGSVWIARSAARRRARSGAAMVGRLAAMFATAFGFTAATYVILTPHTGAQFAAFPPLLIAAVYSAVGIWRGLRWSIVGVVLAGLTLGGYVFLQPYLLLWLALAGGGTLLLTGWWLRHG